MSTGDSVASRRWNAGRVFIYSAAVLLLLTAAAKLVSAAGTARVLQAADPIFGVPYRYMFWGVGLLELGVAAACLFCRPESWKPAALVAWLCSLFIVYRLALVAVHFHGNCSCLGNLTDAIHASPQLADALMKGILAYLFTGSLAMLLWRWKFQRLPSSGAG